MIVENDPIINNIKASERESGISAFMRIKNGEDYLEKSIMSVIGQVDEIICVFNNSNDRTEQILIDLEKKYSKIKTYKYIPEVYPPNSKQYKQEPESSVHSLSYYYNFAMSKTTKKYLFKFDDDEIFFPGCLRKFENILKNKNKSCIGLRGINLFDFDKKLYVNMKEEKTDGTDTLFFPYTDDCIFKKTVNFEEFSSNHNILMVEDCFYHTKRCKKDRGINCYDLSNNENSRYMDISKKFFQILELRDIDSYIKNKKLPNPFNIGFEYINNGKKEYNESIFSELERQIIPKK